MTKGAKVGKPFFTSKSCRQKHIASNVVPYPQIVQVKYIQYYYVEEMKPVEINSSINVWDSNLAYYVSVSDIVAYEEDMDEYVLRDGTSIQCAEIDKTTGRRVLKEKRW